MARLDQPTLWSIEDVRKERAFDDIQGYCVIGHGKRLVWLALLRFLDAELNKASLIQAVTQNGKIATSVTQLHASYVSRNDGTAQTGMVTAVGLSSTGYRIFPDAPGSEEFHTGFAAQGHYDFERYDAVVVLAGTLSELQVAKDKLERDFQGLASFTWEYSEVRRDNQLGFEEGISQPVFFETTWVGPPPSQLKYDPTTNLTIILADPRATQEYGSFLAYVKFGLDIDKFRETTEDLARRCRTTREVAASWFMGRDPLTAAPLAIGGRTNNDFDFQYDKSFAVCPAGAHIRKMTERDKVANRVYRRGTMYEKDGEQGLLFQCFQASLHDGFAALFFKWAPNNHVPESNIGPDAILHPRPSAPHPSGVTVALPPTESITTVKDGEYFYFPSIKFFRRLEPQ